MSLATVSAIDNKYVLKRMPLGYFEAYSPPPLPSIWREFSLQEAPKIRMRLPKPVTEQTLEEKIQALFSRAENCLEKQMYARAFSLMEQVLDITPREIMYHRYSAAAQFHLGILSSAFGNKQKGIDYLSQSLEGHKELLHLHPTEEYAQKLLCTYLERARVYQDLSNSKKALGDVQSVILLTKHYVDLLSAQSYLSYILQAERLGAEILKKPST